MDYVSARNLRLGNNVRALREERNLRPDTLASMVGMNARKLLQLESGKAPFNQRRIKSLAKALDVKPGRITKRQSSNFSNVRAALDTLGHEVIPSRRRTPVSNLEAPIRLPGNHAEWSLGRRKEDLTVEAQVRRMHTALLAMSPRDRERWVEVTEVYAAQRVQRKGR